MGFYGFWIYMFLYGVSINTNMEDFLMLTSLTLMADTGTNWNLVSDPIKGPGYTKRSNSDTTISISVRNFVGRIRIMGTLENSTSDADLHNGWFDVLEPEFIQYPAAYIPNNGLYGVPTTSTLFKVINGNFTYLKAILERDYLKDSSIYTIENSDIAAVGKVELILVNY